MTLSVTQLSCVREQNVLFAKLDFTLRPGELLLVEGKNGVGKSTLLKLLAGFITPTTGDITWQQQTLHTQRDTFHQQLLYLGHQNGIKLGLTVEENLNLMLALAEQEYRSFATKPLSALQLDRLLPMLAKQLSAGQKRRLALAKLFLLEKPLWILDEPLTALDAETQTILLEKLSQHLTAGGMAVISSHHPLHLPQHTIQTLRLGSC